MKTTCLAIIAATSIVAADSGTATAQEAATEWTVAKLAREVRATLKRFDTVVLEATYNQKRDANAFSGQEPLIVQGSGSLVYRSDQERWFMRNDGYSFRTGTDVTTPRVTITGYDGEIHYSGNDRVLKLGEEGFRSPARPKSLIWETMLTYDYLDRALSRGSTKIVFQGQADGHEVVELESTWGPEPHPWKLWTRLAVDRSFLPLSQKLWYSGKLYADSYLEELTPVAQTDHWYPSVVKTKFHQQALGIIEEQFGIRKFQLPSELSSDQFKYEPPYGVDVIDRRSNLVWHNDPWWDELMPWMGKELGWPRNTFQWLGELKSYADLSTKDQTAPPIDAAHWVNDKPIEGEPIDGEPWDWKRKDRAFTVIYFCGDASRLIDPHPRWTTELGHLAKLIEPIGGDVIGVATSDTPLAPLQAAAKELMIGFPFAIDKIKEGDNRGATHKAYRLQHYFSVLIVDKEGMIHLVGEGDAGLVPTIGKLIPKDDFLWLEERIQGDGRLNGPEDQRVRDKWIELRHATVAGGTISGKVDASLGGTVKLLPQFRMLIGSNPGGYRLFRDDGGRKSAVPDPVTGVFAFTNLPRGTYELTLEQKEGENQSTTVVLATDDDSAVHNF